jgi:hypothetical protein
VFTERDVCREPRDELRAVDGHEVDFALSWMGLYCCDGDVGGSDFVATNAERSIQFESYLLCSA